ncbi:MAG TPA: EAL domain-containing protein [Croceibacterium sp.]|nr:EAL domain-containing protein [Croceibacterium sp.]
MDDIEFARDRRTNKDRRANARDTESTALVAALERGAIEILFQPQFAAVGGKLIGAEALARWNLPDCTVIGAAALFEAAERGGLATRLSRHVAVAALGAAAQWREGLQLSLNVTAVDLAEANFANAIAAAVAETDFPPERLTLEITEQALVANLDRSAERLRQLADLGVRIALDDFGAGFCNFGYLKRLPLHYLKLDRSMVDGIDDNPRDLAVLRGIISMAVALGLDVVAEGVEREAQRSTIEREGCIAWQGFLGARPLSAVEFAEMTSATFRLG